MTHKSIGELRNDFEIKFGELTIHHEKGKRVKVRKPNSDMEMAWDFFEPHLNNRNLLERFVNWNKNNQILKTPRLPKEVEETYKEIYGLIDVFMESERI